ncbi:hypothetical protein VB796_21455 [Arcicella sp. LKC2W]|uniref:hypothetical protein n=1 Tax=Arcicella sp. LKC2W TaxID=2984198 RepID=UPI002B21B105|nr:hypothetical protein [Arcicella sp. LKC2W]MEA5461649.1 hypothetical protein [Arcicella sp. LKC2W]
MLTIEEIKKRKAEGKRKWRSSLLPYIKDKFDQNLPAEAICNFLFEAYGIKLSNDIIYQIKAKHNKDIQNQKLTSSRKEFIKSDSSAISKQSLEPNTAEKIYQKIYESPVNNNEFDLGKDF